MKAKQGHLPLKRGKNIQRCNDRTQPTVGTEHAYHAARICLCTDFAVPMHSITQVSRACLKWHKESSMQSEINPHQNNFCKLSFEKDSATENNACILFFSTEV